jgi:hypothetical protein
LLAVVFWNNHIGLIVSTLLFIVFYVWLYWRIVQFKTPRWMVKRDRRKYRAVTRETVCVPGAEAMRDRRRVYRMGFLRLRVPRWLGKRNRRYTRVRTDDVLQVAASSDQSERN